MYTSSNPTRWWWFAGDLHDDVIRAQLDWVNQNGFGGVEIAWVYPQDSQEAGAGRGRSGLAPVVAQVAYAKQYADQLGLGCANLRYIVALWRVRCACRGCHPRIHPQSGALATAPGEIVGVAVEFTSQPPGSWRVGRYAHEMSLGLADALQGTALFCDSWYSPSNCGRATGAVFKERFG
jgi:hypothetical protein